jgi:outer membrane protein OmpA-like peptidoglycan-associated protein
MNLAKKYFDTRGGLNAMPNNRNQNAIFNFFLVVVLIGALAAITGSLGCSSSRTKKGADAEGAAGATIGGRIGGASSDAAKGAVSGGTSGALGGGLISRYMDEQAKELAQVQGAATERLGDKIRVTWDSAILFDFDSAMLKTDAQQNIGKMGEVFQKYPDTDIVIAGHTDNKGAEDYNLKLSERRAASVKNYLVGMGVDPSRLQTVGFGEMKPIASNETEEGRLKNRRVEIDIRANEALRERAAKEQG